MADLTIGPFLTARQACDEAGYSRPDSFIRAWRAARLPVYKRPSGRNLVAVGDFERFIGVEDEEPASRQ